jgi:homoserine kinase
MLPRLLPLAGTQGILGVALSGAGPAVLVIVGAEGDLESATETMRLKLNGLPDPEFLVCSFEGAGANRAYCPQFSQVSHR